MEAQHSVRGLALIIVVLLVGAWFGSGAASAAELGDYRWERRPLLVFAPTERDPQLVETVRRIEASRCEFASRDMVVGLVVTEGSSALDGQVIDAAQSQRLRDQFAIDDDAFTVLLIGKDGGEKRRVSDVPDLQAIYALIDGMPMRSREMDTGRSQC
ncbi:DUF4174 domain-containing protein [Mycobacterium sp. 236(2023)]|uniref:DUF4174 domain-containing protein n=1 Tax=Mycobacterium sp. 236(2023) TaxID=3038163 RepID=UPI0024156E71|nr:DUF4174 domain-containing protein [Mycobacterium sp. 236(2023)]MDG4667193.1 DUF4174 domain-containing protein [Mycobacterium sp. 236(2023)]